MVSRTDVLGPGGSASPGDQRGAERSSGARLGAGHLLGAGEGQPSISPAQQRRGAHVAEAAVNAAAVPATRFVTFAEQGEGQFGTGVAYANPSATAAHVTFTAKDAAGQVLASVVRTLLPGGHDAHGMGSLFGLTSFTGSLEVTSTVPIVSLSINLEADPVFSSLPPGEIIDIPGVMLAPANEAAFNDLFVGKRATTNYPAVYVDFVSPGRFRETEGSDIWTGSYTYRNTGPNTGTVTFNYDDGDRCVASFTFVSTTAGTATYTCNDGSSGGSNWLLVAISAPGAPDLVVQPGFILFGTVSDGRRNGPLLAGAVVRLENGQRESTTTGPDGRYRFPNVSGTVTVTAAAEPSYAAATVEVTMDADRTVDFTLEHTGIPPYAGTVFITPDVLGPSDPTSFRSVTFAGRGMRDFWDRPAEMWTTVNAYLFDVQFTGRELEFQIHPEFGSREAARAEVDTYAPLLGRIPAVLLSRAKEVEISASNNVWQGNGSAGIFHIYTGQGREYIRDGFVEEVFLHEGGHLSLDLAHANSAGWRSAQEADGVFISDYARDFPDGEDIAESILPYFAVRYRPERLTEADRYAILAAIPNRLIYFDEQGFDMFAQ